MTPPSDHFFPDLARFDRGQRANVNLVETDRLVLDASRHDPFAQRVDSQHHVSVYGR